MREKFRFQAFLALIGVMAAAQALPARAENGTQAEAPLRIEAEELEHEPDLFPRVWPTPAPTPTPTPLPDTDETDLDVDTDGLPDGNLIDAKSKIKGRRKHKQSVSITKTVKEVSFLDRQRDRMHKIRHKWVGDPNKLEEGTETTAKNLKQNLVSVATGQVFVAGAPANHKGVVDPLFEELKKDPNDPEKRDAAAKALVKGAFNKKAMADLAGVAMNEHLELNEKEINDLDAPGTIAGVAMAGYLMAKNKATLNYQKTLLKQRDGKGARLTFGERATGLGKSMNPVTNTSLSGGYGFSKTKFVQFELSAGNLTRDYEDPRYDASVGTTIGTNTVGAKVFHQRGKTMGAGARVATSNGGVNLDVSKTVVVAATETPATEQTDVTASITANKVTLAAHRANVYTPTGRIRREETGVSGVWTNRSGLPMSAGISGGRVIDETTGAEESSGTLSLGISSNPGSGPQFSANGSLSLITECDMPGASLALSITDANKDIQAIVAAGYDPRTGMGQANLLVQGSLEGKPDPKAVRQTQNHARWRIQRLISEIDGYERRINLLPIERLRNHMDPELHMLRVNIQKLRSEIRKFLPLAKGMEPGLEKRAKEEASAPPYDPVATNSLLVDSN